MRIDDMMIDTPGGRLFTRSWRSAKAQSLPPLLLFHDSLGCIELWRDFPHLLAQTTERRVIAYDRLGFGQSQRRQTQVDRRFIEMEAARTLPFLQDPLEIGDFVAIGHSVGGGMAAGAAAEFPSRCRALITIAAQAVVEEVTLDGIRRARRDFALDGNRSRLVRYHGEKTDWVLMAWIDRWLSPEFRDWSLDPVLERVRCPVLAIHGDSDEYGSPEQARRIAGGRGSVVLLPQTGHVPHRECPELLAGEIAAFLRHQPA